MSTRNVIVASSASNRAKKIEGFTGSTFADLKNNSVFAELYQDGVEAILSPGNTTLTRNDAILPAGDFKVFLVPTKNKAGMTSAEARQVGTAIQEAILKAVSQSSDSAMGELKSALIETIEEFFGVDLSDSECPECDDALEEAKRLS